jgi:hypothetical protein
MTPLRRAQRTAQPRGPVLPPQPPGPAPRDRCSTRSPERPPPPRISVRTALSRPPGGRQRQSRRQQDVLRMIHDRPVVTVKDITIACVDHREAPARDNGQERGTGLLLPDEGGHPRNSLAWAPTIGLDGGSRREALGPSCAHSLLGPSARHPSRAAPRSARTPSSSPLDTCFDPDAAEGLSARYELDLGESTFPLPRGSDDRGLSRCRCPDAIIESDAGTVGAVTLSGRKLTRFRGPAASGSSAAGVP